MKGNIMKSKRLFLLLLLSLQISNMMAAETSFKIVDATVDGKLKETIESNTIKMIEAFRTAADAQEKSVKMPKDIITPEAIKGIKQLWKTSAMCCPKINIIGRCMKTSEGYQVRGVPIDLLEADIEEQRQELTIDFLPSGKISNVSIALAMHQYEGLMASKNEPDAEHRKVIIDFVEYFRTAYNRKDLKYLQSVFSDNALIITGRILKEVPKSEMSSVKIDNKIVYIKQTKQEYMRRLSNVFKRNKYINVKFEEVEIARHPKFDDVYGVTLKQYWHSDRYSDEGYLFIMIDFHDQARPLIQVRTWQPYKDDMGNVVTSREQVFHLGSFNIVR